MPQGRLQSQDSGKHLHDVLDLLQKHTLVEADISAQAERIKAVQGAAQRFTSHEQGEVAKNPFPAKKNNDAAQSAVE